MVTPGYYSQIGYDHYDMLRTLQDIYGLPYMANSATAKPIEEIWFSPTDIEKIDIETKSSVYPNPITSDSKITFENKPGLEGYSKLQVFDLLGNVINQTTYKIKSDSRSIPLSENYISKGIYYYRLTDEHSMITSGKFIVD